MIGIVVALPVECRTLHRQGIHVGQSLSFGPRIQIRISGMGPERAVAAATALHQAGALAILNWGCAAALKKSLSSGQLLLPRRFITPEGIQTSADPAWWSQLESLLAQSFSLITDPLAATSSILSHPDDKQALYNKTKAAAVDMESSFLALWARERKIPFASIRAVADTADTVLPDIISAATNLEGDVDTLHLLWKLLCHPLQLPALLHLGRQFKVAHNQLYLAGLRLRPHHFCLPC